MMTKVVDSEPPYPTAGLQDFSFVRLFTGRGETIHAVGRLIYHPRFPAARPVLTSPVLELAKERSWMRTESRVYELRNEADEQPVGMQMEIALILCGRAPSVLEWLRRDGSVYLRWEMADLLATADRFFADQDKLVAALKEKLANKTH